MGGLPIYLGNIKSGGVAIIRVAFHVQLTFGNQIIAYLKIVGGYGFVYPVKWLIIRPFV